MPISVCSIKLAPGRMFDGLRHDLSGHFLTLNAPKTVAQRSNVERDALDDLNPGLDPIWLSSRGAFRMRLGSINRTLTGGYSGWRNGEIRLADNDIGNQVFFPPPSAVPRQIETLRRFLLARDNGPAIFRASVAMALLLNCHPFTDGNGRTARVLFNLALREGGMPATTYLPFYEIGLRSDGGYQLALRQAEIRGEWEAFLSYVLATIELCRRLRSVKAG